MMLAAPPAWPVPAGPVETPLWLWAVLVFLGVLMVFVLGMFTYSLWKCPPPPPHGHDDGWGGPGWDPAPLPPEPDPGGDQEPKLTQWDFDQMFKKLIQEAEKKPEKEPVRAG